MKKKIILLDKTEIEITIYFHEKEILEYFIENPFVKISNYNLAFKLPGNWSDSTIYVKTKKLTELDILKKEIQISKRNGHEFALFSLNISIEEAKNIVGQINKYLGFN